MNLVRVAASTVGHFLADPGSGASILPRKFINCGQPANFDTKIPKLFAANNSKIQTFGARKLSFDISSLNRKFVWTFVIADVCMPILGHDFFCAPTVCLSIVKVINSLKSGQLFI